MDVVLERLNNALRTKPKQHRSKQAVQKLVEAANAVFGEVGYRDATMRMIAQRAGVATGSLYRFFPDKKALGTAVVERYRRVAVREIVATGEAITNVEDAPEAVRSWVLDAAKRQENHRGYYALSDVENPGEIVSATHAVREELIELGAEIFTRIGMSWSPDEKRRVANHVIETVRHFLSLAPAEGQQREDALRELQMLVLGYLQVRLRT